MKSVRLAKSAVRTSIVRHDDHPERPSLDPTCPICAVDVGAKSPEGIKEGYAVTPCGHVFGGVCIKRYLAITDKPMCPVCRADLFHACLHPVLPSPYDPKKSRLSRDEAAAKAFPNEPQHTDCSFCRHRKIKYARRMRRQEVLEAAARKGDRGGGSGSSEGGDSDDSESPGGRPGGGAARGVRLALQILHITAALARLTLDAARIRKIKVPPEDEEDSESGEPYNEDGELDGGDIIMPGSPRLSANRSSMPPVPGPYGHWDLANKGPDWKFLGWYDQQEPKMKTRAEHFS